MNTTVYIVTYVGRLKKQARFGDFESAKAFYDEKVELHGEIFVSLSIEITTVTHEVIM